jgi:hypothetical protein
MNSPLMLIPIVLETQMKDRHRDAEQRRRAIRVRGASRRNQASRPRRGYFAHARQGLLCKLHRA